VVRAPCLGKRRSFLLGVQPLRFGGPQAKVSGRAKNF